MSKPGIGPLIAAAGGILLLVSLFLPWTDGPDQTGWEFSTTTDVFLLIAALVAVASLFAGPAHLFRPDITVNAAADILGVISTVLLAWLLLFDFPAAADPAVGAYLALIASIAIMGGAGDYSMFRRPTAERT
jgi:hypothetical protein